MKKEKKKMSHLVRAKVKIQAKNKNCILSALKALGIKDVQISDTNSIHMTDYYGKTTRDLVAIRAGTRSQTVGFELHPDGNVTLHGDSIYINQTWQNRFMQCYSTAVIKETAALNNFSVSEEVIDKNGEIYITLDSNW
jgi:hypothetical protein